MGRRLEMPPRCRRCLKGAIDTTDGFCFPCANVEKWNGYVRDAWSPEQARVDGSMYFISVEPPPGRNTRGLGFGGRRFRIRFNDGRRVTTHNLWFWGEIPADYRAALPDNAVFVAGKKRKEVVGKKN